MRLRNAFIVHPHADGSFHVQAWPKKRGNNPSAVQAVAQQNFAAIQRYSKSPVPEDNIAARILSEGTMKLPRDLITMAAFGTLIQVTLKDGTVYYPARAVTKEVQVMLDSISNTPGSMLVRSGTEWIGLAPGLLGQVLTGNGAGNPPSYKAAAAGGGAGGALLGLAAGAGLDTGAFASKATYFGNVMQPFKIGALWFFATHVLTATYVPFICTLNGLGSGNTIQSIEFGDTFTEAVGNNAAWRRYSFPLPVTVAANVPLAIGLSRTDASDTTSVGLWRNNSSTNPAAPIPAIPSAAFWLAHKVPAVGQAPWPNDSTGAAYLSGAEVEF